MPTLRRILKYTPVVVMGLLVVVWISSIVMVYQFTWTTADGKTDYYLCVSWGSVEFGEDWFYGPVLNGQPRLLQFVFLNWEMGNFQFAPGDFDYGRFRPDSRFPSNVTLSIPVQWLIVAMLPLAIGQPVHLLPLPPVALPRLHGTHRGRTRVLLALAGVAVRPRLGGAISCAGE
jgi:hypothetical protein